MDISKLVEDLNDEIRKTNKPCFSERVYRDEPIIRTASSLFQTEPPEYRLMRKLGATYDRTLFTESRIFYEQAKFMERFEDYFEEKTPFMSFYPTYRVMSLRQQRTYFSWRTKVRHGDLEPIDLSYVFIYLYELLNQIGVKTRQEAFDAISTFADAYAVYDETPKRYAKIWLHDFVIYHGMPAALLVDSEENEISQHCGVLSDPASVDDDRLFEALRALSTYTINNSRFYKSHTADYIAVCTATYREMSAYFSANRKHSFCESLLGKCRAFPYEMFASAVVYDNRRAEDRTYSISALDRYVCTSGKWLHYRPAGGIMKSKQFGAFLRNVDAIMRNAYEYPFELKAQNPTKLLEQTVRAQIQHRIEQKTAAERRVVTIDFSVLDRIRTASEATKEKILTEEERDVSDVDLPAESVGNESAVPEQTPAVGQDDTLPALTADETMLLNCLLQGTDPAPACKQKGVLLSVLADALNERLFDLFGDTVIEFDGETPVLVEDYRADLQSIADKLP